MNSLIISFRIESMNYDGSCRQILTESLPENVFALSYYDNALFFSHWKSLSLQKFNITTNQTDTVAIYSSRSFGVKIYTPKQPCKYFELKSIYEDNILSTFFFYLCK